MTPAEQAVIEAAVEWARMKEASRSLPWGAHVKRAARDLEQAVSELHGECDGRWEPKED